MFKVDFEFSIVGDRNEQESIAPRSKDNIFDARLEFVKEGRSYTSINLCIFSGMPFAKDDSRKLLESTGTSILTERMKINRIDDDEIVGISFLKSRVTNVSLSRDFDNSEYGKTVISLDRISLHFERKTDVSDAAVFHLDDSAYKLVNQYYSFLTESNSSKWHAKYENAPIKKLGYEFSWQLKFHIDQRSHYNQEIIHKSPVLYIKGQQGNDQCDIECMADLILGLASFFRNENIQYHRSEVYRNGSQVVTSYVRGGGSEKHDVILGGLVHLGYRGHFHKYLSEANFDSILINQVDILRIINRFVFSKHLLAETKFLLLYNLLERLKGIYIESSALKQEFSFTPKKKELNRIIREKLLSLSEYVEEDEREEFISHVVNHVRTIKYKKMLNQFGPLFARFYQDFDLSELSGLVRLRSHIVHGGKVENVEELHQANKLLKRILGILIKNIIIEEE